jgi:hypothetical protein
VSLRDPAGVPIEAAAGSFDLDGPDGGPAHACGWFEGDQLRILTAEPWVDLRLAAQGFRRTGPERIVRDTQLLLAAGPRLRVVLAGERPALPHGYRLVARLHAQKPREPLRSEAPDEFQWTSSLDEAGSASWALATGGEVRVELVLAGGSEWRPIAERTFTVPDEAREHTVEVGVEAGRLRAALDAAGR